MQRLSCDMPFLAASTADKTIKSNDNALTFSCVNIFPLILDTGASLAITLHKDDSICSLDTVNQPKRLGGMANGLEIQGKGLVNWKFITKSGHDGFSTHAYFVPETKVLLLSPQCPLNIEKSELC